MGCAGHSRYNVCAVAAESVTHRTGPERLADQLHVLLKVLVGCQLQSASRAMTTPQEARDAVPQQQQQGSHHHHRPRPPATDLFSCVGGSGWRKSA